MASTWNTVGAARTGWEEVRRQDVQEWIVWLLERYSAAYASN